MSLTRLTGQVAELGEPAPSSPPPQDPGSHPPSNKRLRLEEPAGVPEAGWRLPLVPRLSEVEKAWALSPRPFPALRISPDVIFDDSTDLRVEKVASGEQIRNPEWRASTFEMNSCLQSPPSQSPEPGVRASRRFSEARLCEREVISGRSQAEVGRLRPDISPLDVRGLQNADGKQYSVPGRDNSQEDHSVRKPTENLQWVVPLDKETKATFRETKNGRKGNSVTQSNSKENNLSASRLEISKSADQPRLKTAKPSSFSDSTIPLPELPSALKSKLAPVYLKQRAREKNDKRETYVTGFRNIYGSENRLAVKRQKLLGDRKSVGAENRFSGCCESNGRSVSVQNIRVRKKPSISGRYCNRSRAKSDGRDPDETLTVKLQNANWEEAETCPGSRLPSRLEKCHGENYNTGHVSRRNRENSWVMRNYKTKCETVKNTGEKLNLLQFSERALVVKDDCFNTTARNARDEQPRLLVLGTLGSHKAVIHFSWLRGEGENDNMLQLRCYTSQKDFYLSNLFENFITERFSSRKSISAHKEDNNSILAWHGMLTCLKQTDVQTLIIRNINVNGRNNTLSIYSQASVSKPLNIILKTNIASLLNNFDSLTGTENDSKLEEGCIFKWMMCLNYPKNTIVENHIVYLGRTLNFSTPLGDNMKPMLEKKKLFKTEQVFEEFKKKTINFFSMITKNTAIMDFDDMDEISLRKEISYKSQTCPEQVVNVKNWAHCSKNTMQIHVNSLPQFLQNNNKYINENFYEINMHNKNLDTERKQEHNKISGSHYSIFEDVFNVRQQAIWTSHYPKHSEQTDPMILTQVQNYGNLLRTDIEARKHDLILKEEENVTAQSLTYCCQVHKDIKIEKEEKNSFYSMDDMFSVQPVSLMNRTVNVEETKYINQNNLADKNEYESILQENELANSKHFYPKNDSTDRVKHQFEADLSVGNNECFQDLTAKCLSTEVTTIGKDFEMKHKFDLVLEELHMFHEMSKENGILSTVETHNGQENYFRENNDVEVKTKIKKDLEIGTDNKICASSLLCDTIAGPHMHKRQQSLFKWETIPRNREQEVPNVYSSLRTSEGELLYSTSEEDCEKPSTKRPAFPSDDFMEEKNNYLMKGGSNFSNGISRVLPLKTCSRPIRVGLSRKAKLKQLHPYLK